MSGKTAGDAGTAALAAARSALQPDPATGEAAISALARQRARRRRQLIWAARAATLVIIIGGWQLFTSWKIVDPFFFGQPSGIWHQLTDWARNGTQYGSIWLQVWITMKEALLGFVLGVAAGVVFGVLLGQVRFLADVLGPYIKAMNALPRIVLGSIFVVWLGLGTTSKVMLAAVLVFFVVFFNAFQGVREVDRNFIAGARVLGASRAQITRHVVLPSALTWIIASLHVAFGFAIIGAIVGEFVGSRYGIGLLINVAKGSFDAAGMYAAIVLVMLVALAAEYVMTFVENRLAKWRPQVLTETQ
jgi:NitT/TauT family transport system permease protein